MLDKSIPYADFWMVLPAEKTILEFPLKKDFSLKFYQKGDEKGWCEIETSVLEFDQPETAMTYFEKTFLPYPSELNRRMLFVENAKGEKIATCTGWMKTLNDGRTVPQFHWLAVKPEYSGQGLAKTLVSQICQVLRKIYPDQAIYLHSQTWSKPAVFLYRKFGFEIMPTDLNGNQNEDYEKALKILDL
ncbi:GNAT family N-acetyltransferase [Enterococcus sp. AZ103]|uniref:GNAT family N-acetyltransferase n=1 Tax=Enterococcus sp. AZ103 TaxID=2774628 RepID=UPI003F28AE8F